MTTRRITLPSTSAPRRAAPGGARPRSSRTPSWWPPQKCRRRRVVSTTRRRIVGSPAQEGERRAVAPAKRSRSRTRPRTARRSPRRCPPRARPTRNHGRLLPAPSGRAACRPSTPPVVASLYEDWKGTWCPGCPRRDGRGARVVPADHRRRAGAVSDDEALSRRPAPASSVVVRSCFVETGRTTRKARPPRVPPPVTIGSVLSPVSVDEAARQVDDDAEGNEEPRRSKGLPIWHGRPRARRATPAQGRTCRHPRRASPR
jgi:hypothetical protein